MAQDYVHPKLHHYARATSTDHAQPSISDVGKATKTAMFFCHPRCYRHWRFTGNNIVVNRNHRCTRITIFSSSAGPESRCLIPVSEPFIVNPKNKRVLKSKVAFMRSDMPLQHMHWKRVQIYLL